MAETVGVVVIGRNEGERLRHCLVSLHDNIPPGSGIIYVDSGSTDGSVASAQKLGAHVVELDMSVPFTAARARNEGATLLAKIAPQANLILFLDGDCRLCPGFLPAATAFLAANPGYAVVCGRRRELNPTRNAYHRLAEMEWNTPIGDAPACGGDALLRRDTFETVGGFDARLIAGEEPELCVRLRSAGHKIRRIDTDMTLHDVDMSRFSQWWSRSVRAGFAFALGASMHGSGPQRHWRRQAIRPWIWALGVPLTAAVIAVFAGWWAAAVFALYLWPLRGAYRDGRRRGASSGDSALFSLACLVSKWAEVRGQIRFYTARLLGRRVGLIEYKKTAVPA